MMHTLVGAIARGIADRLDETVSEEDIRACFGRKWAECVSAHPVVFGDPTNATIARSALREAACAAVRNGWLDEVPRGSEHVPSQNQKDTERFSSQLAAAQAWAARLPQGRVLSKGLLATGTGRHLDVLATHSPRDPTVVGPAFEMLIRHIEIRRRECLRLDHADPMLAESPEEQFWIERHEVAVALSRQSLRVGDIRLLNAALKLNDWAVAEHRRIPPSLRLVHFLRAIAEQEAAMGELLGRGGC